MKQKKIIGARVRELQHLLRLAKIGKEVIL